MLRSVVAIVTAAVVWTAIATLLNLVVRHGWSDYAAVEQAMTFSLPMLAVRLLVGVVASLAAGFAGALVAKGNRKPVVVFAVLMLGLFVPIHYRLWTAFPAWYHLFFLASLLVFPVLGAYIATKRFGNAGVRDEKDPGV
jgi:hypothetical protein